MPPLSNDSSAVLLAGPHLSNLSLARASLLPSVEARPNSILSHAKGAGNNVQRPPWKEIILGPPRQAASPAELRIGNEDSRQPPLPPSPFEDFDIETVLAGEQRQKTDVWFATYGDGNARGRLAPSPAPVLQNHHTQGYANGQRLQKQVPVILAPAPGGAGIPPPPAPTPIPEALGFGTPPEQSQNDVQYQGGDDRPWPSQPALPGQKLAGLPTPGDPSLPPSPTPIPQSMPIRRQKRWSGDSKDIEPRCQPPECPVCPSPPCDTDTEVVWVDQVTTVDANQKPEPHEVCKTVTHTSTYWRTDLGVWETKLIPTQSTYWVWEKIPHVVHGSTASVYHKVIPGPCLKPPPDWCQGGWDHGVWKGEGEEPCWDADGDHHHHHYDDGDGGEVDDGDGFFPHLYNPQIITLIMIGVFLLAILILWNVSWLALIFLLPFQMYTNCVHEGCHVLAGLLGGAQICSVTIDPGCGPLSNMRNGFAHFTLFAGYVGSLTFGSAMTVFAFDEKCSKIMYLVHAPLWFLVFWFTVGLLPKVQILFVVGGSVAMWFVFEGRLLRFHNLFLGLMSLFYPLWDAMDDFIHRKENPSDATFLARLIPNTTAGAWAFLFVSLSNALLALMIVLGLHFFRGDIHAAAVNFLPTTHLGDPEARAEDAIKQY